MTSSTTPDLALNLPLLLPLLMVALLFHFLPQWGQPEIFFALTVPASLRSSATGRAILRGYRLRLWLGCAVALVVLSPAFFAPMTWLAALVMPVALGGFLWAFFAARHEVAPHAVPPAGLATLPGPAMPRALPGPLAFVAPLAVLAAAAVVLLLSYDAIPTRFVTHWNGRWEADGWAQKSVWALLAPLALGALISELPVALGALTLAGARRVHTDGEAAAFETARRRANQQLLSHLGLFVALVFAAVALLPLAGTPATARRAGTGLVIGVFVGLAGLLATWFLRHHRLFTAATRSAEAATAGGPPIGDRSADSRWKLGLFYYNPDDPALFVEKRFGIGYDLNFGRPAAWLVLAVPLAFSLAGLLVALLRG